MTFNEILDTATDLAVEEGSVELAYILRAYPKDPGHAHRARWCQLIDKATWVLKERNNAIQSLVTVA